MGVDEEEIVNSMHQIILWKRARRNLPVKVSRWDRDIEPGWRTIRGGRQNFLDNFLALALSHYGKTDILKLTIKLEARTVPQKV